MLYGLECLELTQAEKDKLDAFQIKGLRRILHIPPTHIDRKMTNDAVIEKASVARGNQSLDFLKLGDITNLNCSVIY